MPKRRRVRVIAAVATALVGVTAVAALVLLVVLPGRVRVPEPMWAVQKVECYYNATTVPGKEMWGPEYMEEYQLDDGGAVVGATLTWGESNLYPGSGCENTEFSYELDDKGSQVSMQANAGDVTSRQTTVEYDDSGRPIKLSSDDGSAVEIIVREDGERETKVTGSDGTVTRYDSDGIFSSRTVALSDGSTWTIVANSVCDESGRIVMQTFNVAPEEGKYVGSNWYGLQNSWVMYAYDGEGRIASVSSYREGAVAQRVVYTYQQVERPWVGVYWNRPSYEVPIIVEANWVEAYLSNLKAARGF